MYIDSKKDEKMLKYFTEEVVSERQMTNKEWLVTKILSNMLQLNNTIIIVEQKQMVSDLNFYIRMNYSSI